MPWLANIFAALSLFCCFSNGSRLQQRYIYDESPGGRNMNVATYLKRCSHYLSGGELEQEDQRLPPDCLDDSKAIRETNSVSDSVSNKVDSAVGALDRESASMLGKLFGLPQTTITPAHPTQQPELAAPHQMPAMYYNDFYDDLLATKRNDVHSAGCDCKVTNELIDLGNQHFPRYLMNAVCESRQSGSHKEMDVKCTRGSNCKPLEYKVKILTLDVENVHSGSALPWLSDDVTQLWKFKTVTVTAGCFCAK